MKTGRMRLAHPRHPHTSYACLITLPKSTHSRLPLSVPVLCISALPLPHSIHVPFFHFHPLLSSLPHLPIPLEIPKALQLSCLCQKDRLRGVTLEPQNGNGYNLHGFCVCVCVCVPSFLRMICVCVRGGLGEALSFLALTCCLCLDECMEGEGLVNACKCGSKA